MAHFTTENINLDSDSICAGVQMGGIKHILLVEWKNPEDKKHHDSLCLYDQQIFFGLCWQEGKLIFTEVK